MPVTAKLSKAFYDRLGEDVARELVEWFNLVDATYRSDLREINELNFARFDAKMEHRVSQLDAKITSGLSDLRAEINTGLANAKASMEKSLRHQTMFFFGAWASLMAAVLWK